MSIPVDQKMLYYYSKTSKIFLKSHSTVVIHIAIVQLLLSLSVNNFLISYFQKNFLTHLTMSLKFTRIEARQRITTFPGKLKGVLHSQEDATNIFFKPDV